MGATLAVLLLTVMLYGCENEDSVIPEELYNGFWMENQGEGRLLHFNPEGSVSNYIYDFSHGTYYAYQDPLWEEDNRYLMDPENNMLFINPGQWFYILYLTHTTLTLDDGEARINFIKYGDEKIRVVSKDEFDEIFPEPQK